ncbi:hypothetical protein [Demequina soli]|uniref:hypothetical protein n=1 Tax=Demequina soli TaxID=1638987 RepID=UPI000785022B|nr:hypothetical protein [Demequina soli]
MRVATRLAGAVAATVLVAATLAACGSPTPDTTLPDLSGLGLEAVSCDDTTKMAGIGAEAADAEVACWTGTPDGTFITTADAILKDLLADNAGGEDVSKALCWDDSVNGDDASACRAILVGDVTDGMIVSTVVALKDPAAVLGGLSDNPTDDEVAKALTGADVEVLVFSEPAADETGDL